MSKSNMEFKKRLDADYNPFWLVSDVPLDLQTLLDYDTRTDDKPVYVGFAKKGVAASATEWLLFKCSYDGSNRLVSKKCAFGSWDNRTTYTYE